ncbi:hypothetical protein NEIMUCOT_05879 [Neisseria mucosa ATCC 25996]|uniref:Uncharacterized protein n=1 Tax=Neisseria mucosa (strain ATCC 25996 / DSM 4631 / NCTC 10774 / M26) TaxID=546266 RepID=D2ZZ10_NEIM2|nr:hypothetical protein NEIMUCOT_05879 [Neisseria mucosa ATCC 25996]
MVFEYFILDVCIVFSRIIPRLPNSTLFNFCHKCLNLIIILEN